MKTPHTIRLYQTYIEPAFDPVTGDYTSPVNDYVSRPCLINFVTQAKGFQLYGSRTDRVMICRFSQEEPPFNLAEYNGKRYRPIEAIDAPVKGAVRLKEVAGD